MRRNRSFLIPALPLLIALGLSALVWSPVGARAGGLRVLIVGGGPEPDHNQVAIERNVYYVSHLLPAGVPRTILFADGDPHSKTVLYEEDGRPLPPAERVLALLFGSREDASPTVERFRAPNLGRLDGPAERDAVAGAFDRLRRSDPGSVLLYFTGHGSPDRKGDLDNNVYDLWNGEDLSVRQLSAQIASLPPDTPVTLVMVECFSGAFGNVLFAGGDSQGKPVDREIAGFFATTRERMAAGCTPEVNEAEYRDFTSYFFAALTGQDRVGRRVTGADYNHDGRVGMDEAFAYSLAHDVSIDVPVCTSDVFLRRFVPGQDAEIFQTPYSQVRGWATPAQGAALDALSEALQLAGEARLGEAYQRVVTGMRRGGRSSAQWAANRRFRQARDAARQPLQERWPALARQRGSIDRTTRTQALAEIEQQLNTGGFQELLAAEDALSQAEEQEYQLELADARVLRFVRLAKSIVLAHRLEESGDAATRDRFHRLLAAEARSPLPMAASHSLAVAGRALTPGPPPNAGRGE
jgi:hypothetical protein